MRIKFDIKFRREIDSGKYKVMTADNKPVKVERWDLKGDHPVLATMMTKVYDYTGEESWEEERAFCYSEDGHCSSLVPADAKFQLYIETGDNLTEAERMLYNMINDHVYNHDSVNEKEVHSWMEENFMPVLREEMKKTKEG